MGGKVLRTYATDPNRDLQTLECYRFNKILLGLIGEWPFSPEQQRFGITILLCLMGNFYILEIAYVIKSGTDFNKIIDCFAPIMVHSVTFFKLSLLMIGAKSVKEIFIQMQYDWNTITREAEREILQRYANNSKFLTLIYMVWMYSTLVLYLVVPMVPMILNYIKPLNESRQRQFPSHLEYFIDDPTERYWPLFFHQTLGSFSILTIILICDSTYFTCVGHVCGIFASLNYKLDHLTDEEERDEDLYAPKDNNRVFAKVVDCIGHHQKAIKFAEHIEKTYYICNLIEMISIVVAISISGLETVINLGHAEAVRSGLYCIALLIHVFFISLPGQALHDHSTLIFHATYNCEWYSISKMSRDLLKFIALRSLKPCQLTAGKFFVIDLTRFTAVVQTSMSYFTVLTSMR